MQAPVNIGISVIWAKWPGPDTNVYDSVYGGNFYFIIVLEYVRIISVIQYT